MLETSKNAPLLHGSTNCLHACLQQQECHPHPPRMLKHTGVQHCNHVRLIPGVLLRLVLRQESF